MKLHLKIFITAWIVILTYGFVCPYLISASNSSHVFAGFMVLNLVTILLVFWWKGYIKILIEKIKEYYDEK